MPRLPIGLRRALAGGRWLPLVGAGLSANAATADGRSPPTWNGLGRELACELSVEMVNPLDVLSAVQASYDRTYLVNRLAEALLVDDAAPGTVHRAFAQLPFDMVVTTNVDFLLEQAYQEHRRPCVPLIGESQLGIPRRPEATYLLKFHGDLYHPNELVITEDDYDGYVQRHPVLTTFLSFWFLNREPVLIGYSLDDPDLREILAMLRERLGRMSPAVWAILSTDPYGEEAKFARRGLKPIVLEPNPEADRSAVLAAFFGELRALWEDQLAWRLRAPSDATTAELRRASGISPQLALFVASRSTLALYRDFVFPSVPQSGLIPVGVDDVRTEDRGMAPMAIDIALSRAAVVVYDMGHGTEIPLDYVASRRRGMPMVLVTPEDEPMEIWLTPSGADPQRRPADMGSWQEEFVEPLIHAMRTAQRAGDLPVALNRLSPAAPVGPETSVGPRPGDDLGSQLATLRERKEGAELLLTALALLEAELRGSEAPPQVGATVVPVSGGRMARLRDYFGADFDAILQGVRARHDLLQGLTPPDDDKLLKLAQTLEAIARQRRNLQSPAARSIP